MGKLPAFLFYPNDWSRDLEEHPLEIEGAWIRLCCKLWYSETRGKMTRTIEQWERILHSDAETVIRIFEYLKEQRIAEVEMVIPSNTLTEKSEDVTLCNAPCNGNVTVISRRMIRDEKERETTRLRVQRHRTKQPCNGDVTEPVTDLSRKCNGASSVSVTSSVTKTKKENIPTEPENLASVDQVPPVFEIPLNDGSRHGVTQADVDHWSELFPAVDVPQEIRGMIGWTESHPDRKKTRRGVKKFMTGWLARKQDTGRHNGNTGNDPASKTKLAAETYLRKSREANGNS